MREIARFALPYLGVPSSPGAPYLAYDDPEKARARHEKRRARALARLARKRRAPAADAVEADEPQRPLAIVRNGRMRVPNLRGMPLRKAMDLLAHAGLAVKASGSGVVLSQRPAAGVMVTNGHSVKLRLARVTALTAAQRFAEDKQL